MPVFEIRLARLSRFAKDGDSDLFHGFPQFFRIPPLPQALSLGQLELHRVRPDCGALPYPGSCVLHLLVVRRGHRQYWTRVRPAAFWSAGRGHLRGRRSSCLAQCGRQPRSESIDVGRITPQEYDLLVGFLKRRESMAKSQRPLVAAQLANYLKEKLNEHKQAAPECSGKRRRYGLPWFSSVEQDRVAENQQQRF